MYIDFFSGAKRGNLIIYLTTFNHIHKFSLQNTTDPIIGTDINDKVFYTHLSTLLNSSLEGSYFDKRFNSGLYPGEVRKDDIGRDIYFVDRSAGFEIYGEVCEMEL